MSFINLTTIYGTDTPIPYGPGESARIQTAQSGDTLFLVHPNHQPATIKRVSEFDWRYELFDIKNGPYMDRAIGDEQTTLEIVEVTDRVILRSVVTTAFNAIAVNDLVEYPFFDKKVLGRVVSKDSTTQITVEPYEDRCFEPGPEVYSPGRYNGVNNGAIQWASISVPSTNVNIGFSHSGVTGKKLVGNYIRFPYKTTILWARVLELLHTANQAGRFMRCDVLTVRVPSAPVTRIERKITATLRTNSAGFFVLPRDVGRWYRLIYAEKTVHAKVLADAGNTATSVKVELSGLPPFTNEFAQRVQDNATNDWRRGAFYTGNWPATIAFHQGRLVFGGTAAEPQTLWMSRVEDYDKFSPVEEDNTVQDDSAITVTLASSSTNEIYWMNSRVVLLVGTSGGEWQISASVNREALTPTNIKAEEHTSFGSEYTMAIGAARAVLHLQGSGRKLREMIYDYSVDQHVSTDLCIFAEHILKDHQNGKMLAYQQLPDSTIYVVCNDGQVAVLVYEPDQKVFAWSRFILGGNNARVNSAAVEKNGDSHLVYLNVTRSVNGVDVTSIETLRAEWRPESPTDRSDMIFMDAHQSISLDDITGTEVSGDSPSLALYRGETVCLLIDSTYYENISVPASGALTLPAAPTLRCVIGYPYRSLLETLPLETESQIGTAQGKTKRIHQVRFRLLDSLGFVVGPDESHLRQINPFRPGTPIPADSPFFSGDVRIAADHGFDTRQSMVIATAAPTPLTLLAIYPEVTQTQ